MKSLYTTLLLVLSLVAKVTIAQGTNTNKSDTTVFIVGENTKIIYVKNKEPLQEEAFFKESSDGDILIGRKTKGIRSKHTFFTGIDLGVNTLSQNGDLSMPNNPNWRIEPAKSLYWGLNLFKAEIKLIFNQYLLTGLGVNYRSFNFTEAQDITVTPDTTRLSPTTLLNPHKNKLRATYLHVPLMLSFNTSQTMVRNFHVSVGVVGNLRIGSVYKQKYRLNGDFEKRKHRDNFNLAPYLLDGSIRIGYSKLTFFANYALTPLFVKNTAPDMQLMSFGVQILGF